MVAYTSLDTDFDPTNDLWQSANTNINCSPVADCAGYDDGFQLFQANLARTITKIYLVWVSLQKNKNTWEALHLDIL